MTDNSDGPGREIVPYGGYLPVPVGGVGTAVCRTPGCPLFGQESYPPGHCPVCGRPKVRFRNAPERTFGPTGWRRHALTALALLLAAAILTVVVVLLVLPS